MVWSDTPGRPLPGRLSCHTYLHPQPRRRGSRDTRTPYPHRPDTEAVAPATAPGSSSLVAPCAALHAVRPARGPPRSVVALSPVLPHLPPVMPTVTPAQAGIVRLYLHESKIYAI